MLYHFGDSFLLFMNDDGRRTLFLTADVFYECIGCGRSLCFLYLPQIINY